MSFGFNGNTNETIKSWSIRLKSLYDRVARAESNITDLELVLAEKVATLDFTWTDWTPTWTGGFTSGGAGARNATYLKVGKLCFVNLTEVFGTFSSAGTLVKCTNLPFTPVGSVVSDRVAAGLILEGGGAKPALVFVQQGVSSFEVGNDNLSAITDLSGSAQIRVSFFYETA